MNEHRTQLFVFLNYDNILDEFSTWRMLIPNSIYFCIWPTMMIRDCHIALCTPHQEFDDGNKKIEGFGTK